MPKTPEVLRRKRTLSRGKTSEELELEHMAEMRQELAQRRRKAEHSRKRSLDPAVLPTLLPPITPQPITVPREFHFQTRQRAKQASPSLAQPDSNVETFVKRLRQHKPSPYDPNQGPTQPRPFHFASGAPGLKRKRSEAGAKTQAPVFKPVALQVNEFCRKTPNRFRSLPSKEVAKGPVRVQRGAAAKKPELTVPKTPALETRSRQRQVTAISFAEKEEREVEQIKKHQFKANPVNPRVMSGESAATRSEVTRRDPPVKQQPFKLETSKRATRSMGADQEPPRYNFRARPLNLKILEGVVGVKEAQPQQLTQPQSPAFALRQRLRPRRRLSPEQDKTRVVRSHQVPHQGVDFMPVLQHKVTDPEPFSFEGRDQQRLAQKREHIQEMQAQALRPTTPFKAQPLPAAATVTGLPEKHTLLATKPAPFNLMTDQRGAKRSQEWSKQVEEEMKMQQEKREFKSQAQGEKLVVHQVPFVPEKAHKPLTEVSMFSLNTERRTRERETYAALKQQKEAQLAAAREEWEQQQRELEKEEIAKLRAAMTHKPNPIHHFKAVQVRPSSRALTQPQSPNFSERLRKNARI